MNQKQISIFLKEFRLKNKLSMYRVSVNSGLTINQISRIESGKSGYTVESLYKICKGLGLKINIVEDNTKDKIHGQ